MRRFLALIAQWFSTEHGICMTLLAGAGVLAIAPLIVEGAIPLELPASISIPRVGQSMDGETSQDYVSAHAFRSYRYMRAIGRGEGAVLWNPRDYTGTPFLAEWNTRALSPFSIPFYLFDLRTAFIVSALLKIFTGGVLAFYVCGVLGLTRPFALFVGVAHALGAGLLVWTAQPVGDAAPWLPLVFLFAERLSLGQVRYWPSGAFVFAFILLAGALQAFFSMIVFFGIYFVLRRGGGERRPLFPAVLSALVAMTLALALAAILLLPYAEWRRHSVAVWPWREMSSGLRSLLSFIIPLPGAATTSGDRVAAMFHIGLAPVLLSGLWPVLRTFAPPAHRRRIDSILGLGWLWLILGVIVAMLQPYVPPFQRLLLSQLLLPCAFAIAFGAAATAEAWLQLRPDQSLATVRRYALVVPAIAGVAALAYIAAYVWSRPAQQIFTRDVVVGALVLVITILVLAVTLIRPWARFMGYTLAVATALQLIVVLAPLQPRTPWREVKAAASALDTSSDDARIAVGAHADAALIARAPVAALQGFAPRMPNRLSAFLARATEHPALLERAGVTRFLLAGDDIRETFMPLRPGLRLGPVVDDATAVFDVIDPVGRAHMLHDVQAVRNFQAGLLSPDAPPVIEEAAFGLAARQGLPGRALLEDTFRPTRFSVNVYRTDPGVLRLADTYYPGWRARVDGALVPIFPVDGAFRGVHVPTGAREVEFRYGPASFQWGRVVSFAALTVCLFGLAHLTYFRFRDQYFRM